MLPIAADSLFPAVAEPEVSVLAPALLSWYASQGRTLPWRGTRDPYRIWLSEVMLQQTGVQTVIPYYQRFLEQFPSVEQLAAAPLDAVIALWAGLGYYSRARHLHAAARQLCEQEQGRFPSDIAGWLRLPGIGRSTAGAICALAFDLPTPVLDGNVRRVLCRLFALDEDPRRSSAEKQLWRWAGQLTPSHAAHDYTQAIMDLGATVCVPTAPRCTLCPWQFACQACARGLQSQLPIKRRRDVLPHRHEVAFLIGGGGGGGFAVRQRPLRGMLAGLWEFPSLQRTASADEEPLALAEALSTRLHLPTPVREWVRIQHVYSHFRVTVSVYRFDHVTPPCCAALADCCWLTALQLQSLPLHGSHKKILHTLLPST